MRAHLILNPNAGTGSLNHETITPREFCSAFHDSGIDVVVQRVTPRTIASTIREALVQKPDAIITGGGDGTISTAAGCLVDTKVPLGVLPLGTLNHFAKDIGMPVDWREAIAALGKSVPRPVDVGEVNRRVFINNCSLGAYPEAVRLRELMRRKTGRGKALAMLAASFAVFRRMPRLRVMIETRAGSTSLRAPFVLIANNEYSGSVLDASLRERLDAGQLWLYTTRAHRRITLLRMMWQCVLGRLEDTAHLERRAETEFRISSEHRPTPIAIDGESIELNPPFDFRIRPGALVVLSPLQAMSR